MARVFGGMKGNEVMPDLSILYDRYATEEDLLGITIPTGLSARFDPIKDEPRFDSEFIGVDKDGIYVYLHPDVLLSKFDDELSDTIRRWRRGDKVAENVYQSDIFLILEGARSRRDRS